MINDLTKKKRQEKWYHQCIKKYLNTNFTDHWSHLVLWKLQNYKRCRDFDGEDDILLHFSLIWFASAKFVQRCVTTLLERSQTTSCVIQTNQGYIYAVLLFFTYTIFPQLVLYCTCCTAKSEKRLMPSETRMSQRLIYRDMLFCILHTKINQLHGTF